MEDTQKTGWETHSGIISRHGNGGSEPIGEKAEYQEGNKETTQEFTEKAKSYAKGMFSERKDSIGQQVSSVANAIREAAHKLRDQGQSTVADYTESLADQIQKVSTFVSQRNLEEMITDTKNYARNNKAVFLGGAFVLGFVATRLLKSARSQ